MVAAIKANLFEWYRYLGCSPKVIHLLLSQRRGVDGREVLFEMRSPSRSDEDRVDTLALQHGLQEHLRRRATLRRFGDCRIPIEQATLEEDLARHDGHSR